MLPNKIEYQVRPVTRYIVTRFEQGAGSESEAANALHSSSIQRGEYDNADVAYEVAYALCHSEHLALGWKLDDPRIQYPLRLSEAA